MFQTIYNDWKMQHKQRIKGEPYKISVERFMIV